MPARSAVFAGTPATVHFWTPENPNETFATLEKALEHCRKNITQLPAIEVFVHSGQTPEPIITGNELESLVKNP